MGKWVFVCLVMAACGGDDNNNTTEKAALGAACTDPGSCNSANCVDGVCCDSACSGSCEACSSAKTGKADGVCDAVSAGTDPDHECTADAASSCGAAGTGCNGDSGAPGCQLYAAGTSCDKRCDIDREIASTCDGSGTCVEGDSATCGDYVCGVGACKTTCATANDCAAGDLCTAQNQCVKPLRIALETGVNSCLIANAYANTKAYLTERGHTVTIVSAADVDTLVELSHYDVLVIGSMGDGCTASDIPSYDAVLPAYVAAGGAIVTNGWVSYDGPPVNLAALLPVSGGQYVTGPVAAVTPVGNHPILTGIMAFGETATYAPSPALKTGATQILDDGSGNPLGAAWTSGGGRIAFLGPLYFDSVSYQNQGLTNGTNAMALRLLAQTIEWAGGAIH